jgi:ribosomal protein L37AE/L43A
MGLTPLQTAIEALERMLDGRCGTTERAEKIHQALAALRQLEALQEFPHVCPECDCTLEMCLNSKIACCPDCKHDRRTAPQPQTVSREAIQEAIEHWENEPGVSFMEAASNAIYALQLPAHQPASPIPTVDFDEQWFNAQETRFAHGQYSDRDIASSAWDEGQRRLTARLKGGE